MEGDLLMCEKVILPLGNLQLNCPKCGQKTRYKKTHHYGPEGQYCSNCKEFICDMVKRNMNIFVSIPKNGLANFHKQVQDNVKRLYEEANSNV